MCAPPTGCSTCRSSTPRNSAGPAARPQTLSSSLPPGMPPAWYAACFENALMRVAREKAPLQGSSVAAHVGIGREEDGYFRLKVDLEVSAPGRERAELEEFARIAHEEVCPYSRATRGNIEVSVHVVSA